MTHLFRPQDPTVGPTPPVGTWSRVQWAKGRILSLARTVSGYLRQRRLPCILWAAAVLSLVGELVMLAVAMYLIDLTLSLMELWAELARKHLELTL
jgi:hypothetical protein